MMRSYLAKFGKRNLTEDQLMAISFLHGKLSSEKFTKFLQLVFEENVKILCSETNYNAFANFKVKYLSVKYQSYFC